jgi:hypothetical protein
MIAQHQAEVDVLIQKIEKAESEVLESSIMRFEQNKYEDRVKLIKKMHDEEIAEIRRVNRQREEQLEQQILGFHREREKLYSRAKDEARNEEKKKRAKFQLKVERIKRQEVAEIKR